MSVRNRDQIPKEAVQYMIHHVFLPPKLPQEDDYDPTLERQLLDTISEALHSFAQGVEVELRSNVQSVKAMVDTARSVHDDAGTINMQKLLNAFKNLSLQGGAIPLHVKAQNAGILISKVQDEINFEVFELSPLNDQVIQTKGRLKRCFPAGAASISMTTFCEEDFQSTMAQTISKMSHQEAPGTQMKVKKAHQYHAENRERPHPKLVTELLMGLVRTVGQIVAVTGIWKNTREEVLWKNASLPWRRSPMWLLMRVAMQLKFARTEHENASELYKTSLIFFMAHIQTLSSYHELDSDMIYSMNAKISRRLLKINTELPAQFKDFVEDSVLKAHDKIKNRWCTIIDETPSLNLLALKQVKPTVDAHIALPELDRFIASTKSRIQASGCSTFIPSGELPSFSPEDLPSFRYGRSENRLFALAALEKWVEKSLSGWVERHIATESTCGKLRTLMQDYHQLATVHYKNNPEGSSIMILTVIELWIACDKSACAVHELLREHDPEIPLQLFQHLILPFQSQLDRLFNIEKYLLARKAKSKSGAMSIFQDFGSPTAFSVKYFDHSNDQKELLAEINKEASALKTAKQSEFAQKQHEYQDLMHKHDQSSCQWEEVLVDRRNGVYETVHSSNCPKCDYKRQAESVTIQVHEWPLPTDATQAKTVVFELSIPIAFAQWRAATAFMLIDVLYCKYEKQWTKFERYTLDTYGGLSSFSKSITGDQRIILRSTSKPHMGTHRKLRSIGASTINEVCVHNGLLLRYFDDVKQVAVAHFGMTDQISKICFYGLPQRSASLKHFLMSPRHPNEIIARQAECPSHMTLSEYGAYCTLPYGYEILWTNILTNLTTMSIDFTKLETQVLLLQVTSSAGPMDVHKPTRRSHALLTDELFGEELVARLKLCLQSIEENWESWRALANLVLLATRLHSSAKSNKVKTSCSTFLSTSRNVAFEWMKRLRGRARDTTDELQQIELTVIATDVALACGSTFDMEEYDLCHLLTSSWDAAIYVQCSISIQERSYSSRPSQVEQNHLRPILFERWKKLSYRALTILKREILKKRSSCVTLAVSNSWSGFQSGSPWSALPKPHEHWLFCMTQPQGDCQSLEVHLNLLSFELLVDGRPLQKLPSKYYDHPKYPLLFGRSTIEALPPSIPGMDYSSKSAYAGYSIHLGLHNQTGATDLSRADLLIHASRDNQTWELVPNRLFRGIYPTAFVDNFVHWYHRETGSIEFRPIESLWSTGVQWSLTRSENAWRLSKGGQTLLPASSTAARIVSKLFSTIELPLHINIRLDNISETLDIELPRLDLSFRLPSRDKIVHCLDYAGMSLDPSQDVGTLVGLKNKLVIHNPDICDRRVIIPKGQIKYEKSAAHVEVCIDLNNLDGSYTFGVDPQLERLSDDGRLESKLFLCYLHALTSYCLQDPLTHRTGTEQALGMLTSGSVRSFERPTQAEMYLLKAIASLTPRRCCYPEHERVMQTVTWDVELGFLAQHGRFYTYVRDIFDQSKQGKVFFPEAFISPPDLIGVDEDLLLRDLLRTSTFRVSQFGAEQHSSEYDKIYQGRDTGHDSIQARRVFTTAHAIHTRGAVVTPEQFKKPSLLWDRLKSWCEELRPAGEKLDYSIVNFDTKWLLNPLSQLGQLWNPAHESLGALSTSNRKISVMMWLSTIAFAQNTDMELIHAFVAFYNKGVVTRMVIPASGPLHPRQGIEITTNTLQTHLQAHRKSFESCPESSLPIQNGESKRRFNQRRQREFQSRSRSVIQSFAVSLQIQWPCEVPNAPVGNDFNVYINIDAAMNEVRSLFKTCNDNLRFYHHLDKLQDKLKMEDAHPATMPQVVVPTTMRATKSRLRFIDETDVFAANAPVKFPTTPVEPRPVIIEPTSSKECVRLDSLLARLELFAKTEYEKTSTQRLRASRLLLNDGPELGLSQSPNELITSYYKACQEHVSSSYSTIETALTENRSFSFKLASSISQSPRVSTRFLLERLRNDKWSLLPQAWRGAVVSYALALTRLHRAERLLRLLGNSTELAKELAEVGHQNWNPHEFPETLLLEVDSRILVRRVQEDIASQMRNPPSAKNAVMQLNMGEGKSSVIIPIVAAALANGTRLVRVIVAKPQSKQMYEMLVSKLGGLLGRRVYRMPFSRELRLTSEQADTINALCKECMDNRGILLIQPEHILSFKLMGIECMATNREGVGKSLLQTQHFLNSKSRDIVDESDENFNVKLELIYCMGSQVQVQLSPERWQAIHWVLSLLSRFAQELHHDWPHALEIHETQPGRFPRIRILSEAINETLMKRIANHICGYGFEGFPIARQPERIRNAVSLYISKQDLTSEEISTVEADSDGSFWNSTKDLLYLLRGLFAGGVLSFALGTKRWRVNYGLDSTRSPNTRLAVPYRAKDNPSLRAEFSHPDAVLVLTSLCYYYGGLSNDDLFLAFGHILRSDKAQVEYLEWVKHVQGLPNAIRKLSGINIKDRLQCVNTVFPYLRHSKGAIDYFLSHIVFPKEMREFPHKLSASGWDLGEVKLNPTTGFSGTNDSQHVLPLSVQYLDLPRQKHTNALVLENILREENSVHLMPERTESGTSDAHHLLTIVATLDPSVRVILDVGAQIIELSNLQVAEAWLAVCSDAELTKAVIFVNDNDELSIVDRKGRVEPLQTSPLAQQPEACLVYLDESHTRGIDLKLPKDYRAAVTLGPNLTKDRLVQACMRMRKLGKGQSVVFCIPPEIKRKILDYVSKAENESIDVADVLAWTIHETFLDLKKAMPLWALQGRRFEKQAKFWAAAQVEDGIHLPSEEANKFLEKEAQPLKDRYQPRAITADEPDLTGWDETNANIAKIIQRCRDFDTMKFQSSSMHEEQERELSPEIERERQVEKPQLAEPETHSVHADLKTFVQTGKLAADTPAVLPAFESLRTSSAAQDFDVSQFPSDLLVSADFSKTVKGQGLHCVSDAYQRPVQWIVTGTGRRMKSEKVQHMIIISPFEAQELFPLIRDSKTVTLHTYAARTNLDRPALDALKLFTVGKSFNPESVPRSLTLQLNLFAGQLYLSSYEEYKEVCDMLGLAWSATEKGQKVMSDGFIITKGKSRTAFKKSPVKSVKALMMSIRRQGEGVGKTHVGRILNGEVLEKSLFDASED